MAKAYGMWAGEEPYNCTKRGTVIVGKDGNIVFYHEQPMKEARTLDDLAKASLIADELANRADEFGVSA
jgi:peroxiredoxin